MDIDFRVVKVNELPRRFQPPSEREVYQKGGREWRGRLQKQKLPSVLAEMLDKAAEELTRQEERALLDRVGMDVEIDLHDSTRTKGEWRELLVQWLKREANRFMAAAASVREG